MRATRLRKSAFLSAQMEKLKLVLYAVILTTIVGLMHFFGKGAHSKREATIRIQKAVQAVEDRLPRPPGTMGLPQVERFAEGLRNVDSTGAPESLRSALSNYVVAVERHRDRIRASGVWDTNTAWNVGEAQGEFRRILKLPAAD